MEQENQNQAEPAGQPLQEEHGSLVGLPSKEDQIIQTKQLRKDLDDVIQSIREQPYCREMSLALTKSQEALMWCGMNLKRLGNPNPYPNSRDTSNATVDTTSEGLKI